MKRPRMISAIGTPLDAEERLHKDGLRLHIQDQWDGRADGLLVGGTMGAMQMLSDETYRDLVRLSVEFSSGRGELMVGVGDTSLRRTLDRIEYVNKFQIDGTVAIAPYFCPGIDQKWLVDYFRTLADASRSPMFLYELPGIVGYGLEPKTVCAVADHPNIAGIKWSGPVERLRWVQDRVPENFRIIVAQPFNIDAFVHAGITEFLDGIFSLTPHWFAQYADALASQDHEVIAKQHRRAIGIGEVLFCENAWRTFTAILNMRGIPGRFTALPIPGPTPQIVERLSQNPLIQEIVSELPRLSEPVTKNN
jgi:4-hydroxy-tetrahydrodipicolinate synthase